MMLSRQKTWRYALILSLLTWLVGWVLMVLVDVETVMGTGPVMFTLGITLLAAHKKRFTWHPANVHAWMNILTPLWFTLLVNVFSWSPTRATVPFNIMGTILIFISVPLAVGAWFKQPQHFQAWQCQTCGYPLINLNGDTCPECGVGYDAQKVNDAMVDLDEVVD